MALAISLFARLGKRHRKSPIEDATPSRPTSQSLSFRPATRSFGASCVVPAALKKDKPVEYKRILQKSLDHLVAEQLVISERLAAVEEHFCSLQGYANAVEGLKAAFEDCVKRIEELENNLSKFDFES